MAPIRTWWWCASEEPRGDDVGPSRGEADFARGRALLSGAGIELVVASSERALPLAKRLAAELGARVQRIDLASPGVLPSSVATSSNLVVVAATPLVAAWIETALGLAPRARAIAPPPGSLSAIDWPDPDDAGGRPSLVGLDLDWLPPPPSPVRAKFPGGPGSAPSTRG